MKLARFVSLLASMGLIGMAQPVLAVDGVTEINDTSVAAAGGYPFTIAAPGSYVLTGNLTTGGAGGLVVTATDVVIDLNGFALIGGGGGDGILVVAPGVTVKNGSIRGFGGPGILGSAVPRLKVFETNIEANGGGGIVAAVECLIVKNTIADNVGIGVEATDCKIENNIITDNDDTGIVGAENVIVHNKIAGNGLGAGGGGILSFMGSTIQENVLLRNFGFGVSDSPGAPPGPVPMPPTPGAGWPPAPTPSAPNNIMKNVINSDGSGSGIGVYMNSSALISDNTVSGWAFDGIVCGVSCTIRGNQVNSNNASLASNGGVTAGPGSTVHANSISFNFGVGLVLDPTTGWSNNTLNANTAQDVSQVVPIAVPAAAPHPSAPFDNFCSGAPAPTPVGFGPGFCP